jgi:hypothetical protein
MTPTLSAQRHGPPGASSRQSRRAGLAGMTVLASMALAACSGTTPGSTATLTAATTTSAAAATGSPAASVAVASASPAGGTVSANTATEDELVAALQAGGVANAERWAREVMEYRPYDPADPTLGHLQDELAKYNPDPATLAAILSVLAP